MSSKIAIEPLGLQRGFTRLIGSVGAGGLRPRFARHGAFSSSIEHKKSGRCPGGDTGRELAAKVSLFRQKLMVLDTEGNDMIVDWLDPALLED